MSTDLPAMPRRPPAFLKWAGGKGDFLPVLLDAVPRDAARYLEPFLGGGALLLALREARPALPAVGADGNAWLVDAWREVARDWHEVAREIDRLPATRADYLRLHAEDPAGLAPAARAARLIYLNKTGFRGLFRVNRQGRFNVPWGAYARRVYDPAVLERAAALLRSVELRSGDFTETLADAGPGDFVFLDPPYWPAGGCADFVRYTAGRFGPGDHRRLAASCRDLDRRGVRWALSNADRPEVRELYAGFAMQRLEASRDIAGGAKGRASADLLVTNVPDPC
jgi:DNA adenine methylase